MLHEPPPTRSLSTVEEPTHTNAEPSIPDGDALTVTTTDAKHPEPTVYLIVVVPALTPLTTPVDDTTVATAVLELLQVPLPSSLSVVVAPRQTVNVPIIPDGKGFTVTTSDLTQVAVV